MKQDNEDDSVAASPRKRIGERVAFLFPLLLSSLALLTSFLGYRLTAVRNIKPAIVVSYTDESGWQIKNIGNGPALNVLVAQRKESGNWFCPVRVPPLGQGGEFRLTWMAHTNVRWIGAVYTDIDGRPYSSECADDLTRMSAGSVFPQWSEEQIGRAWRNDSTTCSDAG